MKKPRILVIDDDNDFLQDFVMLLSKDYECATAENSAAAYPMLTSFNPKAILLDLMLGDENGLDVLARLQQFDETIPVIMITDYGSVETAVKAMQMGAYDYITKSPNMQELNLIIEKSIRQRLAKLESTHLKEASWSRYHTMVGTSRVMGELMEKVILYARHPANILLTGENGTGKELVARHIHRFSNHKNAPFVAINCAAIPRELAESELFGHEKGAFTGAEKRKFGVFELAGDGVLFMDEITELDLDIQAKLLRVLQEREFCRLGGSGNIKTSAKVIAASNYDLEKAVKDGKMRQDLYYRLEVLPIHVPPLRDRKEDIPLLVNHFLETECADMKIPTKYCSDEVLAFLQDYHWPGNIRQLRNVITRAVILCQNDIIDLQHLDPIIRNEPRESRNTHESIIPKTWDEMDKMRKKAADVASRKIEKRYVEALLARHNGNISSASREIGISRTNLHKLIQRSQS